MTTYPYAIINYRYIYITNYLSDSKTNCWLSGSLSAFAKSLLSASIMDILPQTTYFTWPNNVWEFSTLQNFLQYTAHLWICHLWMTSSNTHGCFSCLLICIQTANAQKNSSVTIFKQFTWIKKGTKISGFYILINNLIYSTYMIYHIHDTRNVAWLQLLNVDTYKLQSFDG